MSGINEEPIPNGSSGENSEKPFQILLNSDPELSKLATANLQCLGEEKFNQLIKANQRFNTPVYVMDDFGREKKDDNFTLKRLLKEIPSYVESAQKAGLSVDKAHELVIHQFDSDPYEFKGNEVPVALMGRAFANAAERGHTLNEEDFETLKRLVGKSAKYGVADSAMYAYAIAQKIGISTQESNQMISKLIDADGHLSGYTFGPFNGALKTLNIAKVDPNLVARFFDRLGGDRPYYRQGAYNAFREIITFGCPTLRITPQEAMEAMMKQIESGEAIDEVLVNFLGTEQLHIPAERKVEIVNSEEERARYFVHKPGNLELAPLPYQTKGSLNGGVRDLERIALASFYTWEEVGEGFWVYDQNSNTWYSFGGETRIMPERVRHNMVHYDISQLSDKPLMFHCHAQDFEIMVKPPRGQTIFPDKFRDHVTKFLSSTPSRADYAVVASFLEEATREMNPRSFIVHSLGITEFTYPNDIAQLKQMSTESRDIRDQVLLDFDWNALRGREVDAQAVTSQMTDLLNQKLPKGFSIKIYPHGHNLEQETKN